jgi:hypothetical protein
MVIFVEEVFKTWQYLKEELPKPVKTCAVPTSN